jgi:hypothetical protein
VLELLLHGREQPLTKQLQTIMHTSSSTNLHSTPNQNSELHVIHLQIQLQLINLLQNLKTLKELSLHNTCEWSACSIGTSPVAFKANISKQLLQQLLQLQIAYASCYCIFKLLTNFNSAIASSMWQPLRLSANIFKITAAPAS